VKLDEVFAADCAWRCYLALLQWACENFCRFNSTACAFAARNGHLHLLQWLREQDCPWSIVTCSKAAEGGHLEVLKGSKEWLQVGQLCLLCRCEVRTLGSASVGETGRVSLG
jgi:hypothetical protein